mgnify:FL=1
MLRPSHVVLVLLGALLLLAPLHLAGAPITPVSISLHEWLRLALGLPGAVLLPGLALAPLLLRKDLVEDGALDVAWWVLAAAGLNVFAQIVNLNLLRVLGIPIEWPALLGLVSVETAVGLVLLRMRLPELRFARPGRVVTLGGAVVLGLLLVTALTLRTELTVDSSWNWYSERVDEEMADPVSPTHLSFVRGGTTESGAPFQWERGAVFTLPRSPLPLVINNAADVAQQVPVAFLVHGPLGTRVQLLGPADAPLFDERISQLVELKDVPNPVERYWKHGTSAPVVVLPMKAASNSTVRLAVTPPEGSPLSAITIQDWSGLGSIKLEDATRASGYRFMHPYQLLNVTENVRWADEVATDYVLSGRSPDGTSTLHQPPGWTYQFAPARQLISPHMVTASALFFVILLLIGLGVLAAAQHEAGRDLCAPTSLLLGLGVAVGTLQHAWLMISDGSMNFPDNLYALSLLLCAALLVAGKGRTFLVWALLAMILRYPGAVVVALSALSLAFLRADLRRKALAMAMRFGLAAALFCGAMLLVAVFTDALEAWLYALWFETVPEHFNNNKNALPLLRRPLEFTRIWMLVGGGVLFVAIPFRGTMARVLAATAVLYAPFLAFIDHFSHHYFLPLVALASGAAAASIASMEDGPAQRRLAGVFAGLAVALFVIAVRLDL